MKKILILLLIFSVILTFSACELRQPAETVPADKTEKAEDKKAEIQKKDEMHTEPSEKTAESVSDSGSDFEDIVGSWQFASEKNDYEEMLFTFGTSIRNGVALEFKDDKTVEFYIGASGGRGTYEVSGETVTATITEEGSLEEETVLMKVVSENGMIYLSMDFRDVTVWWMPKAEIDTFAVYGSLLDSIYDALSSGKGPGELSALGINPVYGDYSEWKDELGFSFKDLDNNGMPELIIGEVKAGGFFENALIDVYTSFGDEILSVVQSSPRDIYYLTEDGTVINRGSNSASESVFRVGYINGSAYLVNGSYLIETDSSGETISISVDGETWEETDATEAKDLMTRYEENITQVEFSPFSGYLK